MIVFGRKLFIGNVLTLCLNPRCRPHARRTVGVPLESPHVQRESASRWTAVDAVKSVLGSSLKTAAGHSHVTTQRAWSATLEVDLVLLRASVEVQRHLFSSCFCFFICFLTFTTLHCPFQNLTSFPVFQLNPMEEPVSTTTRFTKMGKSSVQTANTNALVWTVLSDVSLCAHMRSRSQK